MDRIALTSHVPKRSRDVLSSGDTTDDDAVAGSLSNTRKRLRSAADQIDAIDAEVVPRHSDHLCLTSRPALDGAFDTLDIDGQVLRARFATSALAVVLRQGNKASDTAAFSETASRDRALGAHVWHDGHNGPVLWPTDLPKRPLGYLKAIVEQQPYDTPTAAHVEMLLIFAEQHLLAGVPTQMACVLADRLRSTTVVPRFKLARAFAHADSEGAFALLEARCYAYIIRHFDAVRHDKHFVYAPRPVKQALLAGIPKALEGYLRTTRAPARLGPVRPSLLFALSQWRPGQHHDFCLLNILHLAIAQNEPKVIAAMQRALPPDTYARHVAAQRAQALQAAAHKNDPALLACVLKGVPQPLVTRCLQHDRFALVRSIASRGCLNVIDAVLDLLPPQDAQRVMVDPLLIINTLGNRNNIDLYTWCVARVGAAHVAQVLRHPRCQALMLAIRHNEIELATQYFDAAIEGTAWAEQQSIVRRTIEEAMAYRRHSLALHILDAIPAEHVEPLLCEHDGRLLQVLLAASDEHLGLCAWSKISTMRRADLLGSHATELCAAAAQSSLRTLCLELFDAVAHDVPHLNATHPFHVALNYGRQNLALQMYRRLKPSVRAAWLGDRDLRALRAAAYFGCFKVFDVLLADLPDDMAAYVQTPEVEARLLRETFGLVAQAALIPMLVRRPQAWQQARLQQQHYALVAAAMRSGSSTCSDHLLKTLSADNRAQCLAQHLPDILPDVLLLGHMRLAAVINEHAPEMWLSHLQAQDHALLLRLLNADALTAADTLDRMPKAAFEAFWSAHPDSLMRAALAYHQIGSVVVKRCDKVERGRVLVAHAGQLVHDAMANPAFDGDALLQIKHIDAVDQHQLATANDYALLRLPPNAVFTAEVFSLLTRTLSAQEVHRVVTALPGPGLASHLRINALAFETQMALLPEPARSTVAAYIAGLFTGPEPTDSPGARARH